jgi:SAM-dependent methyltransferase
MDYQQYFNANREGWDKRAMVHKDAAFYDLPSFKAGKTSLNAIELKALGNVTGKKLLHLQCHFGLDTLSWSREGAVVTGIDFSEEAINTAKALSAELGIRADFFCCNVYDVPDVAPGPYDIVFTSYGVIGWLPDLDQWAAVISGSLKPDGLFYMVEFHPVVWMMDENFEKIKYHYHNEGVIIQQQAGTYADPLAPISYTEYSWNHSLAEVLNALIRNGLEILEFNEYSYSCYNCFNHVVQGKDGYWRVKGMEDKLPMMYSVKARKVLRDSAV